MQDQSRSCINQIWSLSFRGWIPMDRVPHAAVDFSHLMRCYMRLDFLMHKMLVYRIAMFNVVDGFWSLADTQKTHP
jgi:hypothetical protein